MRGVSIGLPAECIMQMQACTHNTDKAQEVHTTIQPVPSCQWCGGMSKYAGPWKLPEREMSQYTTLCSSPLV